LIVAHLYHLPEMKLLLLLLTITIAAAYQETQAPVIQRGITDLTELQYFTDQPGAKAQKPSGHHITDFSVVSLEPYFDLISGIPAARKDQYRRIIPYRKRMQANRGMQRSHAVYRGKKRSMPSMAQRVLWKRGFRSLEGFRSIPEAELLGWLGSGFSNMMYGKREKTFPGNRLPVTLFLTHNKRDSFEGIPRTGAPIRKFVTPIDEEQKVVLFKNLPKIITAVNERLHERIFKPLALETVLNNES
ncbi:unnamed protein product, partial [Meganyctiphanes norvegica]